MLPIQNIIAFSMRPLLLLLTAAMLAGCTTLQSLTRTGSPSPREQYIAQLEKSDLLTKGMVKTWLEAGDPAKHDSTIVTLPFRETGYFASAEPQARFYRFEAKAGQVLTLTSLIKSKEKTALFADLLMLEEGTWKQKEHADTSLTLTYEFPDNGSCLVRLQPELLVNAFYSITLSVTPVLVNPVKGATNKSIGSFYGDPRDGGKRKHEGIDIFAPKGTHIVAPTAGVITRVANGGLGGKTVWMNDVKRGHSYYFAHLDSQWVKAGMPVKQGDVLGTVGNTGNAQFTPSHLHFGVFQRSSKDPIAYIRTMEKLVNELAPDTLFQSIVFKVNRKNTPLLTGASSKAVIKTQLSKDLYLKVIAQSNEWYRVRTADEREGFVEKKHVTPAEKGNRIALKKPVWLLSEALTEAVPVKLLDTQILQGLALYKNYRFVKTQDGLTGWIDIGQL